MFCKLPTLKVSFHFDPSYLHPKKSEKKKVGEISKHTQDPGDTRFAMRSSVLRLII